MKLWATQSYYTPIILIWSLIAIVVLIVAQFYPLTHSGYNYYGIAYSMWAKQSFWYPSWLNTINVQKPPLFYWLTILCWWVFGIQHIIMPLIILVCYLFIAIYTAKTCLIYSNNLQTAKIAGILLLINITFLEYVNLIRFDIQLTFSFILAFYALSKMLCEHKIQYGWLYALATLLGILFKGPVILLFTLPAVFFGLIIHNQGLSNQENNQSQIMQPSNQTKARYLLWVGIFTVLAIIISMIWLLLADKHSQNQYWHTILSQTIQRLDHHHPDPNSPEVTVTHYHWWYFFGYFASYLYSIFIAPFLLILPIFAIRFYIGSQIKQRQRIIIYFLLTMLVPTLFFSAFVGLIRFRYLLPLIPLNCILIAYVSSSITLNIKMQIIESRIYQGFLLLLTLFSLVFILFSVMPATQNKLIVFLLLTGCCLLTVIFGWHSQTFLQRWHRLVLSMVAFSYFFLLTTLLYLYHYPTLATSEYQLQHITAQHQPLIEIDSRITHQGWAQFLARNLKIKFVSGAQFKEIIHTKADNFSPWVVSAAPFFVLKKYNNAIYPLQYSIQSNQTIPVLMPYTIYKQLHPADI